MEPIRTERLTRRTAIKSVVAGGLALAFGRRREVVAQAPSLREPIPGTYSEFIKANNLTPREFSEEQKPEERIAQAVDFIRRYADVFSQNSEYSGKKLPEYRIVDGDNFPISIPNSPGQEWTVVDVAKTLLNNLVSGQVVISYDEQLGGTAGQASSFIKSGERWVREQSRVAVSSNLMKKGVFKESESSAYESMTDADLAIIVLHEFTHGLQDLLVAEFVNSDSAALARAESDPQKFRVELDIKARERNAIVLDKAGIESPDFHTNESQANAVGCLFLHTLNKANLGTLPGTRRLDPHDDQLIEMQRSNPNYLNLFKLFESTQNALNPIWIQGAGA